MIWRYFPIGLRFPVKDFSDETKRTCWQTALSALCAAGASGAALYDAQETYDCGTGGPVYTCIACMEDIKRSRAVGKYLYSLDALMAGLCMHRPFVQANYLESFGPYPLLGKAAEEGASEITDAGRTFLPEYVAPMQASDGLRLLIAADSINADIPAETVTRALGSAAAATGFRVRRMLLANGSVGTVRAMVTAANGRYETISYTGSDSLRVSETIGVLPGGEAVAESGTLSEEFFARIVDNGYRTLLVGQSAYDHVRSTDTESTAPAKLTIRPVSAAEGGDCVGVLDRIGFESAAKQADCVLLFASGKTFPADAALERLNALHKPVCLITAQPDADTGRLMRDYPVLRAVVPFGENEQPVETALAELFRSGIVGTLGKDVANAPDV